MNKQIELSVEKARQLYGKNPEMNELLLANFTKDELTKIELPKSWKELERINGYYIDYTVNKIFNTKTFGSKTPQECVFVTLKQALSALAMAQLSQLMAVYNDGWEPDWHDSQCTKYVLERKGSSINTNTYNSYYYFLAFKTAKLRDEFVKNFEPLIRQYFIMD
jgi:hypothetical protein